MLLEMTKKGEIPDVLRNRVMARGADDLGIEVSEEEITAEMDQKKAEEEEKMKQNMDMETQKLKTTFQMKQQLNKATKLSDKPHKHVEMNDIAIPEMFIEPVVRELYPDEQKVKLADIKVKLDDSRARAELILSRKLLFEKNRIVDSFVKALREGRSAIRNVEVDLAEETTYNDELKELSNELFEYGKRMSANELNKPVPTTPRKDIVGINDRAEAIAQEQEDRLKLNLQMVANDALDTGMAENDARIMFEQEYDTFWNKVLTPTIGMMIGKMFNKGRQHTFDKYGDSIFAYRYTAVLDLRTTDYCRELDGKVFQASDPNYPLLTPPNHYGCRSFWTPIMAEESEGVEVEGKPFDFPVYSSVNTFKDLAEERAKKAISFEDKK
jgi:SPP1 gp7 family putative phage head morphogenesis protein